MMNVLAIGLVLSALAAAGVLSPQSENKPHAVLREGQRVIVVEYERHLPQDATPPPPADHRQLLDEARDMFQEAASLLPNLGQGVSVPTPIADAGRIGVKEKICDTLGTCKEKLSSLVGKGKHELSDQASKIKDKASQFEERSKDATHKISGEARDAAHKISGEARDAVKSVRDAGEGISGNLSSAGEKAVELAAEAAGEVKRNVTDIIQRARDVAYDAAAYVAAPETARAAALVARMVAVAAAFGTAVWVTFVSSYVLAGSLPRQQLGLVQSRLYPVYFRVVAYCIGAALLAVLYGGGDERRRGYNLLGALGMVLVNTMWVEPKATRVMLERMKLEKEEGRGRDVADVVLETAAAARSAKAFGMARSAAEAVVVDQEAVKNRMVRLSRRLKRLNTYSSVLNILTLMGLTWHLVDLARCVQSSC